MHSEAELLEGETAKNQLGGEAKRALMAWAERALGPEPGITKRVGTTSLVMT